MKITYDEYKRRNCELHDRVDDALDAIYGEFNGWPASYMVDVELEIHPETHIVGIRNYNNYGIVGADDAIRFARAMLLATVMVAASDLVGCEVTE